MGHSLDDPAFPGITVRVGASGYPTPVVRATGIRVQTIVISTRHWGETPAEIADNYDPGVHQVRECLAFYDAHRAEIDDAVREEEALSP